jgi:hypothetical protein
MSVVMAEIGSEIPGLLPRPAEVVRLFRLRCGGSRHLPVFRSQSSMSTDASSFGSDAADARRLEPPDQWPPARPLVTLEDRMDVASRCRADRTTARTAEFIPPASPPLVSTAKLDCPAGSSPMCRG